MTVLLAASSLADAIATVGAVTSGSTQYLNDGITYESLVLGGASAAATAEFQLATASADFWFGFNLQAPAGLATNTLSLISFYNKAFSTTQALFDILGKGTGNLAFRYWNGSAWVESGTIPVGTFNGVAARYDIHLKMADTGGVFSIYKNGVLVATMTATDTIWTAATTIDAILIGALQSSSTAANRCFWFNMFVADEDSTKLEMMQMAPSAAGAVSQWTGAYTAIDETGYNDSDTISSGTSDQVSTFGHATFQAKFANFDIKAVVSSGRGQGGAAAPTKFESAVRVGTTVYSKAPEKALTTAMAPFMTIWNTSPATGIAWTGAEVSTAQFGFKSVA